MKKSTIFLLVAVAVLAAVTILVTSKGGEPEPPKLGLRGYATAEQLAAEKTRGMMESPVEVAHTVDEIIIERDPTNPKAGTAPKIRILKEGSGESATWKIVEPVEAPAQKYQVERIVQLFKAPTVSKYTRVIKDADLARYDLEPARRVRLTLKSKGAPWHGPNPDPATAAPDSDAGVTWGDVDLIIGRVEKGEPSERGEASSDTWVTTAADPKTAYLLAGKDLRTALDVGMDLLRDKKVFTLDPNDLTRIEIVDPEGGKIVLAGTRTETPPPPPEEGEEPADPTAEPPKPTVKVTWAITEPANVTADASVDSYARSFASLSAKEFVPLTAADAAAKTAIGGRVWTITADVQPKDGEASKIVLKVADGEGDTIWAQLQGQAAGKEELIALASHSAKQLRKGLDELENRVVFDLTPESVSELTVKGDAGPITVTRAADGKTWAFTAPALPYPADPANLLRQIGKLQATRWAKPSEREAALAALATVDTEATLKGTDGTVRVVRLAKPNEGDDNKERWGVVLVNGAELASGKPFIVADHAAKRFESSVTGLRHKKVLVADKADIKSVEITSADGKETFVLARPTTGEGELALVAPPAGKQTKEDAARSLGSTLGALDAKSFHEGKAPIETSLAPGQATKVAVTLGSGEVVTLLVSTKKPAEGEVYAVADKGPLANTVIGINEYQGKNITKALADFLEDAAPPEVPPQPVP